MTDISENIDLTFIARQQEQLLKEMRDGFRELRTDIGILANASVRLESQVERLGHDVRMIRLAITDHDSRLRKLEEPVS